MAAQPDTLIQRKCGQDIAVESAERAQIVIDAGWPNGDSAAQKFEALDKWLRADGNRRNPGTSADLVCGGLFVAFREGSIEWPALWSDKLLVPGMVPRI